MRTPLSVIFIALIFVPARSVAVTVPLDYPSIQSAIEALDRDPNLGSRIVVEPGVYPENLQLISGVTIRGRETARTILQSGVSGRPIITIDGVANASVLNFTLSDAANAVVVNNSINITIGGNVFTLGSNGVAIDVRDFSTVQVINNSFFNNAVGVSRPGSLVEVTNNIFAENTATTTNNRAGLGISSNCYFMNGDRDIGDENPTFGDPQFVDTTRGDFHLRQGSVCIDIGLGVDVIDGTIADAGAYGGIFADAIPFPVQNLVALGSPATAGEFNLELAWTANLSYLVSNDNNPGSYRVHYNRDAPGPPYTGDDARDSNGMLTPSPVDVGDVTRYTLEGLMPAVEPPAAPVLLQASPRNQTVGLQWSRVEGATSYTVYFGVTTSDENTLEVGNITSAEIKGLENGIPHRFRVTATAQSTYYLAVTARDSTARRNESDFSRERAVAVGDNREGPPSNELRATPQLVAPYPDVPNDDECFIATAAFTSDSAPAVQILRDFRDGMLLRSRFGRHFARWYYARGPIAARVLNRHPTLKPLVRAALWPLILLVLFITNAPYGFKLLVATLVGSLLLLRLTRWWIFFSKRDDNL